MIAYKKSGNYTPLSKMVLLTQQQYSALLQASGNKNTSQSMVNVETPVPSSPLQNDSVPAPEVSTDDQPDQEQSSPPPSSTRAPSPLPLAPVSPEPPRMMTRAQEKLKSATASAPDPEQEAKADVEKVVKLLPGTMKSKGERLLTHLKRNSDKIKWKDNGELVVQDVIVPNSNIVDLVKYTISTYKTQWEPEALDLFLSVLRSTNPPYSLVGGKSRDRMTSINDAENNIQELMINVKSAQTSRERNTTHQVPGYKHFPSRESKEKDIPFFEWTD